MLPKRTLMAVMVMILAAVLIPALTVSAEKAPTGIEGTWLLTIHGDNPGVVSHELASFLPDGVLLTSNGPSAPDDPAADAGLAATSNRLSGRKFRFKNRFGSGRRRFPCCCRL